jgi:predicted nucleic acid-binding protein
VTLVIDASLVVSALVDAGDTGKWAESLLTSGPLSAPHLMPVEVANVLRRATAYGDMTQDIASMAHSDLLDLRVELFPYAPFAPRVWELRENVTSYDAWYVALAEFLGSRVATLDRRLARAAGPRCGFEIPPPARR